MSGEAVVNGGKPVSRDCDTGPLCIVFDGTSSSGNAALVAFIGGDKNLQYETVMVDICYCVYCKNDKAIELVHELRGSFGVGEE